MVNGRREEMVHGEWPMVNEDGKIRSDFVFVNHRPLTVTHLPFTICNPYAR
jgi:hypothetical protein